jgi:hypothetical protein
LDGFPLELVRVEAEPRSFENLFDKMLARLIGHLLVVGIRQQSF